MTTQQTVHRFEATIESLGKQQTGEGWHMVLDWKLPNSRYPLSLYGRDWAEVEGMAVNDHREWVIVRGNLKDGKNAQYASSFFWNWDQSGKAQPAPNANPNDELFEDDAPWQDPRSGPLPTQTQPALPKPTRTPPQGQGLHVEGVVQGHVEKLAVDLYNAQRDISEPIDYREIRRIRDAFFHNVKEQPIQPVGYCYVHEVGRNQDSKKRWYHKAGANYCILEDGKDVIFDAEGNPVAVDAVVADQPALMDMEPEPVDTTEAH
ncbi:MAG: hypothetical protein O2821_12735 [Chloroflexi bacterium]|nr:hypothetical protein [Chloroflexota bacterium]